LLLTGGIVEVKKYVKLLGTGSYLPGEPIKFDDINNYLGPFTKASEKLQKWTEKVQPIMKEMLGIEYCHYAFNNKTRTFDEDNLSLSVKAAKLALEEAKLEGKDIDLLIYGGAYSHQLPPLSTRIQEELGIDLCGELHIHSNCTSVYKAVKLAHTLLQSGEYKRALVVSSIVVSSCFIPEFYNQEKITKEDIFLRWYLCDGAGAFVLSAEDEKTNGFYLENTYIESTAGTKKSAMGNSYPYHWTNPLDDFENCSHHIRQEYMDKLGTDAMEENNKTIFFNALKRMIDGQSIDLSKLKHFVVNMPSRAVRNIISEECAELNIGADKFYSAIENVGYAGPPAALIAIDILLKSKSFTDGDLVFSFVMEVSKFMQAGFTLRYVE
jgi:3-oxoacyl-[acyl-carrier-protein] synthase III